MTEKTSISTKITFFLIISTFAAFLWQLAVPIEVTEQYVLSRSSLINTGYTLITYAFLHGGPSHFGGNMLSLFLQGKILEKNIGSLRTAAVYVSGIIGGGLTYVLFNPDTTVIGASAATSAIMAANIAIAPGRSLLDEIPVLRRLPIPGLRSILNVSLWAAIAILVNIQMTFEGAEGVATLGHLGGMTVGVLSVFIFSDRASKKGLITTAGFALALVGMTKFEPGADLSYISLGVLILLTMIVRRTRSSRSV